MKWATLVIPILAITLWPQANVTFTFDSELIEQYQPVFGNNITLPETIYARVAEQGDQIAIEYLYYWPTQEGHYKYDSHENDWEWCILYLKLPDVDYTTFDKWHYVIGREGDLTYLKPTHTIFYCHPLYRYLRPTDEIDKETNTTTQLDIKIKELTNTVLQKAENQIGLDKSLFDNPFSWKYPSLFGRYTAWKSIRKGFFSWLDYNFDFVDLRAPRSFGYSIA